MQQMGSRMICAGLIAGYGANLGYANGPCFYCSRGQNAYVQMLSCTDLSISNLKLKPVTNDSTNVSHLTARFRIKRRFVSNQNARITYFQLTNTVAFCIEHSDYVRARV